MVTLVPQQSSRAVGWSKVQGEQQSVACHVAVMTCEQGLLGVPSAFTFVMVLRRVTVTFVPQQSSWAEGSSKVQVEPHSTVLLEAQENTGGVVSAMVTVWLQVI